MVISGGDVLEWPVELQSDKEMEMEQTFDEAMWEQDLAQGPPQDDDMAYLKNRLYNIAAHTILKTMLPVTSYQDLNREMFEEMMEM